MASPEIIKMSVDNSPKPATLQDAQKAVGGLLETIKQKRPDVTIPVADAGKIGTPRVNIPSKTETKPRPSELDRVGSTVIPRTSQDIARETILSQVPEEDRDTIDQILGIATGFQTDKGKQLESTADSILTQQLSNIQSSRDRAFESSELKTEARLPELEAELETIRSENDVLTAQKNAAIQAAEREEGVSTSARAGNVARISRDFDLQQANLAIRELASVGKINAATKLIEAKLDLKYGDLEAETKLLTAQLNAISPFLDREDAKAAETRLQLNEIVKTKIADAREADKALEEFKLQSYLFAQQNGATPAILSQIMSSDSREDVASVGGSFIQDPMEKLQMEQTRASIRASDTGLRLRQEELNLARDKFESESTQFNSGTITMQDGQKAVVTADGTVTPVSQIDFADPAQVDALPVSNLTKAVMQGFVKTKDLTPTQKGEVATELQSIGFNPNTYIVNKLSALIETWAQVPETSRGYVEGLKFWESKTNSDVATFESQRTLLTREIARLFDVGVLSDQDNEAYNSAMPSRRDSDLSVVISKAAGIAGAATGDNPTGAGRFVELPDGRRAIVGLDGDTLLDPTTGKPLE